MAQTKVQQYMLFILGQYYKEINRKHKIPFLKVTVSKVEFIQLVKKSTLVSKQARAIYKNLENLEKQKLIEYPHQMLKFTKKGKVQFEKINKRIQPFIDAVDKIRKEKFRKSRHGQMVFFTQGA